MKTIAHIDGAKIQIALSKTKPLTILGRTSVDNFKQYLQKYPMSAIALENSIVSLSGNNMDVGLESLVNVLKGMLHISKRKVAVAYEMLQMENKGAFLAVGVEAEQALMELYKYNAAKIISEINNGALKAWASNPIIANLIAWSKSAAKDADAYGTNPAQSLTKSDIAITLIPILTVASLEESKFLVTIENDSFIKTERGAYTYVADAKTLTAIPDDVKVILHCLSLMQISEDQPNILSVNSDVIATLKKALNIKSFAIDLMAGINEMVIMNDESMSADKAKSLLMVSKNEVIAAMLMDENAKGALQLISTIMDVFERYRGSFLSQSYAKKFKAGNDIFYVVKETDRYAIIVKMNGSIVSVKSYDNAYDMLADEMLIGNPTWHDAVSIAYSQDLQAESSKISVRKKLLQKLTEERKQYEDLLTKISKEGEVLNATMDINPEKTEALAKLATDVTTQLATVNDEISKLTK